MTIQSKPKRVYKHITPAVIAQHKISTVTTGNGSQAVRVAEGDYTKAPAARSHKIITKSNSSNAVQYIDEALNKGARLAVKRVIEMTQSDNEQIATKNSHFVIDHIRGKAVQRNDNINRNITIESVLS